MDHVFENEGKPVPDLGAVAEAAAPARAAGSDAMDVDGEDDEDLRAALKLSKGEGAAEGSASEGVTARVSPRFRSIADPD
jgi:nitrogen fixation protein FixH